MEATSKNPPPLVALSPFFMPTSASQWDVKTNDDASQRTPISWSKYKTNFADIVAGNDYELMDEALHRARVLTCLGVEPSVNQVLVESLVREQAFTLEKTQWLAVRGYDIRPHLGSSLNDHQAWSTAKDDQAFDWAFAPLAAAPDTKERDTVLMSWIGKIITGYNSKEKDHASITLWVSRRLNAIEQARPGIVREWLSTVPRYGDVNSPASQNNGNLREGLVNFFFEALQSSCVEPLADWLDPGRFGHPVCAHLLMESALKSSFRSGYGNTLTYADQIWCNFSRALAQRPEAAAFWKKQSRPGKLVPAYNSHLVNSQNFPGQIHTFGAIRFGQVSNSSNTPPTPRGDAVLPLDPLGRLLGSTDDYVNHLVAQPGGRERVIDCMKSHPAFMAYGFSRFGEELLKWPQAAALEGFRDANGYGAARYFLATCNRVASVFDVCLHRCLRQRKGLCDDALPKLDSLFVEEANRSKYMSMELKKVSREVTREVPRQPAPTIRRTM